MSYRISRAEYYNLTVQDEPGEAFKLLSHLADLGINLLAFTAVPTGPAQVQLTLFPANGPSAAEELRKAGLDIDGPHHAIIVQGDDELGALASVHEKLYEQGVNVFASQGVTDGRGAYGYVLYVRAEEHERAAAALAV